MCIRDRGNWTEALACYRQALVLAPNFPEAHENLGMILLLYGNLRTGFAEYEWRCQTKKYLRRSFPYPLWDGSDLQGQKIILICDQGYGDAIQFIRYVPLITELDGKIIVVCQEPLLRLFSTVAGIEQLIIEAIVEFDVHAPLMSLPHLMGTTLDTIPAQIPYLTAPKPYPFILQSPAETYLKVGIVWAGSPGNQNDRNRSCNFSDFSSILKIPGIAFYSLQKGSEITNLGGVQDLSGKLNDFADTSAIIEQLDLVITVDTSVAHLAGALGKPVWVLLSFVADWRWMLEREDSPWYPTMRLFRQTQPGDWNGVFEKVAVALENWVSQLEEKSLLPADNFNQLKKCRYGTFLYNINDIYIGKSLEIYGEYREAEIELLRQLIEPNDVIVEVGANIGAHTVFLAKKVGSQGTILAFEAQRIIFQTLCANIALNSITNTYCYHLAVGDRFGSIALPRLDYNKVNNFGRISLVDRDREGELVQMITLDSLNLQFCRLIKLNMAGMELPVLPGAADTINRLKPILYIQNDRPENATNLIRYIDSFGYKIYWHESPLYNPQNYSQNSPNIFPDIVSRNMLCLHNSNSINISGLPVVEVTSKEKSK